MAKNIKQKLAEYPKIQAILKVFFKKGQVIVLDYPINPTPRYGYGKPPHKKIYEIINMNRADYKKSLKGFLKYKKQFLEIKNEASDETKEPKWINPWFTGLDAVSLYGLIREKKPKRYFEIGSGNSTKFAKKAIEDGKLKTKIVSIDPHPRAEIDKICNKVIRSPVENVNLKVFDELEKGDILFVDNSHRVFTNSDATVVFLDILPRLTPGVIVEFHDISLPLDYPLRWKDAYNSEQYLLACYLLAEGKKFKIVLPNAFISEDKNLNKILNPLWENPKFKQVETVGGSFWIEMR